MGIVSNKLQDKIAIVTGSTSGMGAAIARLFAANGGKVVLNGRNEERGKSVIAEIKEENGAAVFVKSDISSKVGNEILVHEAIKYFGGVDIVVANAGFLGLGSITEVSSETWHNTIDTNLNSIFYLLREPVTKEFI